ncbi:hypothetical protein ACUNWD_10060 [Sunxiuqinia sp. A32]|uniref:hypothetical protein n=1 Tax=Sunxiuqinia sp. A32 TaxID=3461496 RepID=UPI0040458ED4
MSKYKMTPQEYRKILTKVELDEITLVELKAKYSEESIKENIGLNIRETSKHEFKDSKLMIYMLFTFVAKNKDSGKEVIRVSVRYRVDFDIDLEFKDEVSVEFVKILTDNTVSITLWPYFRQELQSAMSKMNLPQIVLPFKRK